MVKADLLPDPELVDRFVQVVEDEGPSAIAFGLLHGLNLKPSVCMSLSERTPG